MRKNTLTFVLGFAFLFFGTFVMQSEAANRHPLNNKFGNELNKKYTELKKMCMINFGPGCDAYIALADQASDLAWVSCAINSIKKCIEDQEWAVSYMERAMDACRRESGITAIIPNKKNPLSQDSSVQNRKELGIAALTTS